MKSATQEILEGSAIGRYVLPSPEEPNPVSLARAISGICGGWYDWNDPVADQLRSEIGEPKHLVFVIADGFGMNFVNTLAEDSFSRSNLALEARAAFPSSTGPNLLAFGRAQWPGQHGAVGWYVHLPELGARATLFPWVRTRDETSLTDLGLTGEQVYPGVPEARRFSRDSMNFIPSLFSGSVATGRLHGPELVTGYSGLHNAMDMVIDRVSSATTPTYSHIFWPAVDSASHEFGTGHLRTLGEVRLVDSSLNDFRNALPDSVRIVVTADHGHLDFGSKGKFVIEPDDPLVEMVVDAPSGDERTLFFHVKEDRHADFVDEFTRRFGDHFFLISAAEVIELELLGPDGVSEFTLPRLGDYTAIAKADGGMKFRRGKAGTGLDLVSQHGGLHPDEMLVPVVIA